MADSNTFDGFRDIFSTIGKVSQEQVKPSSILEAFDKTFAYLNSEECYQVQRTRWERYEDGLQLIGAALQQGIITPREHLRLLYSLEAFGALVVGPGMGERLKKVIPPETWYQREKVKLPKGFYLLHTHEDQWYAMNGTETIVYTRFTGPYIDENTARMWCVEQDEILKGLGRD